MVQAKAAHTVNELRDRTFFSAVCIAACLGRVARFSRARYGTALMSLPNAKTYGVAEYCSPL